jgi:Rap1a immunity proteins
MRAEEPLGTAEEGSLKRDVQPCRNRFGGALMGSCTENSRPFAGTSRSMRSARNGCVSLGANAFKLLRHYSGTPMRVYIIVAGLALSVIGMASATVVDKGIDLQRSCELLVQDSFRDQGEARSAGSCEGMIETAMIFSPNLPADLRACPPAQGSVLQSAKVLLRYLNNNPDRVNEPGITVAIEAFRDAWPCHGDDTESGTRPKKRAPNKSKQ